MDVFGRYIAIILAVILILIFPLQYIAQGQSENIDSMVCTHATEFAETTRHQGYISLDMYENLVDELHLTGERYEIEMEVAHPIAGKEMAFDQLGDEMPDRTIQKTSTINKSSISSPSKKGYSLTDDNISSFAAHTHTDNCYSGHRHTSSCYVPHTHKYLQYYGDGTTGVPYYYIDNIFTELQGAGGISSYCWAPKLYTFNYIHNTYGYVYGVTYRAEITANGTEQYVFHSYNSSWNYPVPPSFPQTLNYYQLSQLSNKWDFTTFWNRATGENSTYNNYELEMNFTGGLDLCNTTPDFPYKLVCGQVQDDTPDCNTVITGIVANYPNQEVVKGKWYKNMYNYGEC
ncbi:MAG: hypothetical protein K0S47_4093 [Herbinix sp.]|nr:hypothetical protein [Herbinix sp.]